jgi:hypothetical protein
VRELSLCEFRHLNRITESSVARQAAEAASTTTVRDENPRNEAPMRILILDGSPCCDLAVVTANDAGERIEKINVSQISSSEVEHYIPEDWDVVISHIHPARVDDDKPASRSRQMPKASKMQHTKAASAPDSHCLSLLRRLVRRERLSPIELEERRVRQTMVLADMQSQVGAALSAIETGDFDTIAESACRLRDDATNYGFARLSGLGAALYDTVPGRDIRTARNIAQKLMTYMGKTIGYYLG